MGKRRKKNRKEEACHKVIITESPEEKMVKSCQFSGTQFKSYLKNEILNTEEQANCESNINFTSTKWERFSVTLCTEYKPKFRD